MSVRAVILQKNAFASMTYPTDRQLSLYTKAGARRMAFCWRISATVMNEEDDDPTGGALY